jgi:hypothetical protein
VPVHEALLAEIYQVQSAIGLNLCSKCFAVWSNTQSAQEILRSTDDCFGLTRAVHSYTVDFLVIPVDVIHPFVIRGADREDIELSIGQPERI